MSTIKVLEEALSAGKDFASAAGDLRDMFKGGTAKIQALRDEAKSVIDAVVKKAEDGLAAFKMEAAKVESDAEMAGEDMPSASTTATTDTSSAPTTPTITTPAPSVTIAVVPAAASEPAVVTTPIGDVTVQPGTTVHVDAATLPEDAAVTTVPHDGSAPSASTVAGVEVTPDPTVVALAKVATGDAGVTVPAS